ncbi:MAG TPA: WD40 repeat domain-containing protein [Polyangiaceae bacterium]|jgi:WD40 repeat protein
MSQGTREARYEMRFLWRAQVGDYATSVGYSADGSLVAVGAASGEVQVFDAATGRLRWKTLAHPRGVLALSWSPTACVLASAGQDGMARLHLEDGSRFAELPGKAGWVEQLAWSVDGRKLATASGKTVRLWDADGSPLLETEPHESAVTGVAWNKSGTELATCCYGGVHLWNVAAGTCSRHLPWKGSLISLAWSPDDRVMACASQDCSVHFWRLGTGQDSEMTGYRFKPKAMAWDARGSLLATSGDATITCWDFAGKGPEGTAPIQLQGHRTQVMHLAFSHRKALLASGGQDPSVLLWSPRKAKTPTGYAFLEDEISGIAWDPGQRSVAAIDAAGHVGCWQPPP